MDLVMNDGEGGDDCGDDKVLGGIMVKLNSGNDLCCCGCDLDIGGDVLVLLMLYMYSVSDVPKPLDHKLYSKANCLVLNLDAEHWLNECTSSHEVFGIGNSKCDHCLVAEI